YTSGSLLPSMLSLPRSSSIGHRVYGVQPVIRSCGIECRMTSRTERLGSLAKARPVMIRLPVVVGDNGLPPGSLERSYARDVWQPTATTMSAPRRENERKLSMRSLLREYGPGAGSVKV